MQSYATARYIVQNPKSQLSQNNLVFIYPVIVDKTLLNYTNLVRDFISVSMLKELFTSNFLSLVNITSQIKPVDNQVSLPELLGRTLMGRMGGGGGLGRGGGQGGGIGRSFDISTRKDELQRKINQKLEYLSKLLETDPRYSQLRPQVEIVTLQNMIDVPIIVGTKSLPLNSLTLMLVILISFAYNLPLTSEQNLNRIFTAIRSITPDELSTLLTNVEEMKPRDISPVSRIISGTIGRAINIVKRALIGSKVSNLRSIPAPKRQDKLIGHDAAYKLLKITDQEIKQVELFFRFCLSRDLLYSQYKLSTPSNLTATKVLNKESQTVLTSEVSKLVNEIHDTVSTLFNTIVLASSKLLLPSDAQCATMLFSGDYDHQVLYNRFFAEGDSNTESMVDCLEKFFLNEFIESLRASLGKIKLEPDPTKLKEIKQLIKMDDVTDSLVQQMSNESTDFRVLELTQPAVERLLDFLAEYYGRLNSQNKKFQRIFSKIFGEDTPIIVNKIEDCIKSKLEKYFNIIYTRSQKCPNPTLTISSVFDNNNNSSSISINEYLKLLFDALSEILVFMITKLIIRMILRLVDIVKADIEVSLMDAAEYPNYTLVFPVELAASIHTAFVARNWKNLVYDDMAGGNAYNLNQNYLKGIVKVLNNRLQIPNLIVIDDRNQEMYYKLMFMPSIEKIKLQSVQHYIDTNIQLMQQSLQSQAGNQYMW